MACVRTGHEGRARACARLTLVLAALCLALTPTAANTVPDAASPELQEIVGRASELDAQRQKTRAELEQLGSEIVVTEQTIERLDAEIAAIAQDRSAIREAMIAAASAQKQASAEIAADEEEIAGLALREGDLRDSLSARRGTLAHVLGALERLGRKPPPAILVHPDDALGSVRSAILLGSVVPTMRAETDALLADLDELAVLRAGIETRKADFASSLSRQREEEARLVRLSQEKERLEADRSRTLEEMNRRTAELAGRANSLQDLIGALESDLADAQAAEETARRLASERAAEAEERRLAIQKAGEERRERLAAQALRDEEERGRRLSQADLPAPVETPVAGAEAEDEEVEIAALEPAPEPERQTYDVASLRRDMAQLDISAPFSTMKGILTRPVVGEVKLSFGEDDGFGRKADGTTFAARAGDLVTAPADGRILYSGPFRSYGQLLILNAGDGYHIVLAGMREIDVDVGQFVLAGEPVAVMGARRLASAGQTDLPSTEPSLYVEFRKDGKPVDPDPWWTNGSSGRTRNDS